MRTLLPISSIAILLFSVLEKALLDNEMMGLEPRGALLKQLQGCTATHVVFLLTGELGY